MSIASDAKRNEVREGKAVYCDSIRCMLYNAYIQVYRYAAFAKTHMAWTIAVHDYTANLAVGTVSVVEVNLSSQSMCAT